MPLVPFDSLPDDARLWVFGAGRQLTDSEADVLLAEVDEFLERWSAHGQPLTAARSWQLGRFLLVSVDERSVPPSGCSIDAMVRVLEGLQGTLGTSLVDHHRVWFRDGGDVECLDRPAFRKLVEAGKVSPDTMVF